MSPQVIREQCLGLSVNVPHQITLMVLKGGAGLKGLSGEKGLMHNPQHYLNRNLRALKQTLALPIKETLLGVPLMSMN